MDRKESNQPEKVSTYVLGAQKNHLIEMVLLSTHNICFDSELRNLIFDTQPLKVQFYRVMSPLGAVQSGTVLFAHAFPAKVICFRHSKS